VGVWPPKRPRPNASPPATRPQSRTPSSLAMPVMPAAAPRLLFAADAWRARSMNLRGGGRGREAAVRATGLRHTTLMPFSHSISHLPYSNPPPTCR
jgi:hypothetical protein